MSQDQASSAADTGVALIHSRMQALAEQDYRVSGEPAHALIDKLVAADFVAANSRINYSTAGSPKGFTARQVAAQELVTMALALLRPQTDTTEILARSLQSVYALAQYSGATSLDAQPNKPLTVEEASPKALSGAAAAVAEFENKSDDTQ